jgi:IMP cyclohydrolase
MAMKILKQNPYPGRGIIIGRSKNSAAFAYFLTGRSENSRNRFFQYKDGVLKTVPVDASKVADPSLIIYNAVRTYENKIIVSNGAHTDTIYDFLSAGKSFQEALNTQTYEPDASFTPRISGLIYENGYALSVIKKGFEGAVGANRNFFYYENPPAGYGRLISTYRGDGDPLPIFEGEPALIEIPSDIDEFAADLWESLSAENKISLFVKYGDEDKRIFNAYI